MLALRTVDGKVEIDFINDLTALFGRTGASRRKFVRTNAVFS